MRGIDIISIIINAKYEQVYIRLNKNLFSKNFDTVAICHAKKKKNK